MDVSARAAVDGSPAMGRARGSQGFTLIELLVTLAVIAIGVVGISRVFLGTMDAAASATARSHASAIATREVERTQAIPYAQVGLPAGSPATFESKPTVVVTPSSLTHTSSEVINGITFTTTRWVVWEAGTSTYSDAIKRVVAVVTWTDDDRTHTVRADAAVYPGGLGPRAVATTTSTTSTTVATPPGAPTNLTGTLDATLPQSRVNLSWSTGSPAPTTWEVQRSSDGGTTWTALTTNQPVGTTTYAASGLAASTTYKFRVRGLTSTQTGTWSGVVTVTTQSAPPTCSVSSATASPSTQSKKTNGTLQGDVGLTVNTSGTCSTLQAVFDTSPGTTKTLTFTASGTVYSLTIDKNAYSDWSTGTKTIFVKRSGTTVAQIALVITN